MSLEKAGAYRVNYESFVCHELDVLVQTLKVTHVSFGGREGGREGEREGGREG